MAKSRLFSQGGVCIEQRDALEVYDAWDPPMAIISDGGYGVGGFPGDPHSAEELPEWYRPHVERWSAYTLPCTTLWFWNTEVGWASVHPLLVENGWEFRNCHIWDKGIGHIAGNANSKTLRKWPVVTEVCAQYVRKVKLPSANQDMLPLKQWLRSEWLRTGLPLYKTNEACGVKNAATRKYFTKCRLWYFPPANAFEKLATYANKNGHPEGRPYFSIDGKRPISCDEWELMRAKFYCTVGVTNVWQEPTMRGEERIKNSSNKTSHGNQKPLGLMRRIIEASTDPGDVIWEPFGGMCSAAVAALQTGRRGYAAEIARQYYELAIQRMEMFGGTERPAAHRTSTVRPPLQLTSAG